MRNYNKKALYESIMKNISKEIKNALSLNESIELIPSDDEIKNKIYYELSKYKIYWTVKSVDAAINEITNETWWKDNFNENIYINADRVYMMSCWNGGSSLDKSSKYNQAEICYWENNTDVSWYIFVKDTKCELWLYENRYYGMSNIVKKLISFKIK